MVGSMSRSSYFTHRGDTLSLESVSCITLLNSWEVEKVKILKQAKYWCESCGLWSWKCIVRTGNILAPEWKFEVPLRSLLWCMSEFEQDDMAITIFRWLFSWSIRLKLLRIINWTVCSSVVEIRMDMIKFLLFSCLVIWVWYSFCII